METRRKMSTISAIFGDESPHLERTRDARLAEASARTTETRKEGPWTNYTAEELKQMSQGSRTEIAQACERIAAGASMPDVAQEFPTTIVRYHRGLRELGLLLRVGRSTKSFMLKDVRPDWLRQIKNCKRLMRWTFAISRVSFFGIRVNQMV